MVLALVSNPYLRHQSQEEVLGPESQELIEYDYQRQDFYGDEYRFNVWWWVWGESLEQELEADALSRALHCIWWAKKVRTDPFVNVSSNSVPPFEEPRTPTFVLWIGTSISKVIDEKKVGIEAGVVVEKEKIYTIIRDGCFKPHLNLQEKLASLVSRRWYRVVFVEVGTNDISNAPVENSRDLLELKLASYFSSVVSVLRRGLKIVVVKPIPGLDSRQVMNQWFCDRLAQMFHGINNV